jgi:hypothetical protein
MEFRTLLTLLHREQRGRGIYIPPHLTTNANPTPNNMRQNQAALNRIQDAYDNRMPPEYWMDDLEDTPDSLVENFVTHAHAQQGFAIDDLPAIHAYVAKLLGYPNTDTDSWAVEFVAEELSLLYYDQKR